MPANSEEKFAWSLWTQTTTEIFAKEELYHARYMLKINDNWYC